MSITINQLAIAIENEFIRLGVSTQDDPYSGLSANTERDPSSQGQFVIRVYNGYEWGFYQGESLLKYLQSLTVGDACLNPESADNVWQGILRLRSD